MDWLSIYGTPMYQVRGRGTVTTVSKRIYEDVEFELAQLVDGQVFCELRSESEHFRDEASEFQFRGETEFGYDVIIDRLLLLSRHDQFGSPSLHSLRTVAANSAILRTQNEAEYASRFPTTFYIVNLDYFAKMPHGGGFSWEMDGQKIDLMPLADHKEKTQLIRASRKPAATSRVVVQSTNGLEGLPMSETIVQKLCWLLSLAQGCHISWIYHESFLEGRLVSRHHASVPLVPPTGRRLIPANAEVLDDFVESVLPMYVEKEQVWQLPVLFDMFVKATMSQPFLEPAGLHLGILMDYMCGIYARLEGKERLVDETTFKGVRKQLEKGIKAALEEVLPEVDSRRRKKMLRHIGMFQFYPFADLLSGMAKHLGLELEGQAIESFVQQRNNLAHRYTFTEDRDPQEAFNEMMGFTSKFLLAILEFEGEFYDWSLPIDGDWNNRRAKLTLTNSRND